MFFNSINEINRLRKELNRSSGKRISKKDKVTIEEKNWTYQNELNFITSCCNLKIKSLGAKQCVAFLLF